MAHRGLVTSQVAHESLPAAASQAPACALAYGY